MTTTIGYIYLLSNPALSGIIKLGHTKRPDVSIRAEELSSSTSIPLPFVIEAAWLVEAPSKLESRLHARLAFCRVAKNREFFRINIPEAEEHVNTVIYGTTNPSELIMLEMKNLVNLYRKFPRLFKNSDELVTKAEKIIFNITSTTP